MKSAQITFLINQNHFIPKQKVPNKRRDFLESIFMIIKLKEVFKKNLNLVHLLTTQFSQHSFYHKTLY